MAYGTAYFSGAVCFSRTVHELNISSHFTLEKYNLDITGNNDFKHKRKRNLMCHRSSHFWANMACPYSTHSVGIHLK